MSKKIMGSWILDPTDIKSLERYGNISMKFKANGALIYTIHSAFKDEIILMTYEIIGDLLITDQPSSPRKEETEFRIISENKLEVFFDGERSVLVRKPRSFFSLRRFLPIPVKWK